MTQSSFEKPRRGLLLNSADIHVRELKTLAFTDMNVRAIQEQPPAGLFKLPRTGAIAFLHFLCVTEQTEVCSGPIHWYSRRLKPLFNIGERKKLAQPIAQFQTRFELFVL